ncbi:ferredoxin-thioredoxin reductase, variable chain-like [Andrographis paniculata]|uniref:ferredoxin-thioredoxin reductase, variable chain-like n=1 Tax=Andrographis paniculata TaxID=175694 RepID=UPI0021E82295|nr:ferredoxin-thioredoxin reductase, variable chain-like [Andrographis paniculata]
MATSPAFFSSILNIPNSKIANTDVGFPRIYFPLRKKHLSINPAPAPIGDCSPSSSGSCNSAAITNSITLDQDSINDEEVKRAESKIGCKVRVKGPLKVYHVPKVPEFDLAGKVGVLKQYVAIYKGKRISANLPYKVEFTAEDASGRDGKPVKFSAHLRGDEFEFLD